MEPGLSVVASERTKGNEHKLKWKEIHLNVRKNFFTVSTLEQAGQRRCGASIFQPNWTQS